MLSPYHFTWGTLILNPPPCYSRLDFCAQAASATMALSVHSQKCFCGLFNTNPISGCRDKSVQHCIHEEKCFSTAMKAQKQVAIISNQVLIISMFDNIPNSPNTFPNSHKQETKRLLLLQRARKPQEFRLHTNATVRTIKSQKIWNCKAFHKLTN